jgi:hypothetical protein
MEDRPPRRTVLGSAAAGALGVVSGCLNPFSETVRDGAPDDESWKTVSPSPFTAVAESRTPVATFGGSDRPESFGQAVGTTGDTVFVGVPQAAPDGVERAGVVAVYDRLGTGWGRTATLTGRKQTREYFGGQLAVGGSTLLVGNEYNYSGTSKIPVSVFERVDGDDWELTTELTEPTYVEAMAIEGETAVVRGGDTDGLVDVYERDRGEWGQRQTLSVDDPDGGRFVRSVATDGETILVGVPPKSGPKRRRGKSGAVHVFSRQNDTWSRQTTLSGESGTDHFGWSVAVDGERALIGDYINDTAYVFLRSDGQWAREQMYTETKGEAHHYFGDTVAVAGDTTLVAAPHAQFDNAEGAVYELDETSPSTDPSARYFLALGGTDQFGDSIATRNGTTVVTSRDADAGFVSVYEN